MNLNRQLERELFDLLDGPVRRHGAELVAVELLQVGRRRTLRVTIDRPGGVGIDDCARVSRGISPVLDVADRLSGAYDLEVSSPGIERPLQRREDFLRFQGLKARVRAAGRRWTGILAGVEGESLRLETAEGLVRVPFSSIDRAHLDLTVEQFRRLGEGLPPVEPGPDEPAAPAPSLQEPSSKESP